MTGERIRPQPKPVNARRMKPGQRARSYVKRSTRPKARRSTERRRPEGAVDKAYLAFVRSQPCCAPHLLVYPDGMNVTIGHGGGDKVDPHHTVSRGAGGWDRDAIPLARSCHRDVETLQGVFKGWDKGRRKAWYAEQVRIHQERFDASR